MIPEICRLPLYLQLKRGYGLVKMEIPNSMDNHTVSLYKDAYILQHSFHSYHLINYKHIIKIRNECK